MPQMSPIMWVTVSLSILMIFTSYKFTLASTPTYYKSYSMKLLTKSTSWPW